MKESGSLPKVSQLLISLYYFTIYFQSSGVNLIGILPGSHWGTSKDKVLIIGTNWDIQGDKAGDHGSGLASLLEISRVLMADQSYKPEFSVIFVAFDKKNDGCAGSKKFITEYLKPIIIEEHGSSIQVIIFLLHAEAYQLLK